jgi:hypothetical protein
VFGASARLPVDVHWLACACSFRSHTRERKDRTHIHRRCFFGWVFVRSLWQIHAMRASPDCALAIRFNPFAVAAARSRMRRSDGGHRRSSGLKVGDHRARSAGAADRVANALLWRRSWRRGCPRPQSPRLPAGTLECALKAKIVEFQSSRRLRALQRSRSSRRCARGCRICWRSAKTGSPQIRESLDPSSAAAVALRLPRGPQRTRRIRFAKRMKQSVVRRLDSLKRQSPRGCVDESFNRPARSLVSVILFRDRGALGFLTGRNSFESK